MTDLKNKTAEEWRKNVDFFEGHKDEIGEKYGEERYVVVKNQEIIDSGKDKDELIKKYGEKEDLTVQSTSDFQRVIKLHSPRIIRN